MELFPGDKVVRGKYVMDGSGDLLEAAKHLRAYADELEGQHYAGWRLRYTIQEDTGFIYEQEPQGSEVPPEESSGDTEGPDGTPETGQTQAPGQILGE